jgi:DNA-binding LacI/PurR family transcriptional regulator
MAKNVKSKSVIVMFQPSRSAYIEKMYGLFRYIREHDAPWELTMLQPEAAIAADRIQSADGVILAGVIPANTLRMVDESDIPASFITLPCNRKHNVAIIESDGATLSKSVADELLKSGCFNSFVFLHQEKTNSFTSSCKRMFKESVEKKCLQFHSFCEQIPSFAKLPLPCAVFATKDYLASDAIALCRKEGLRVPQDVSVIAVTNNDLFCSMSKPSITTISPDFEQQGYLAAKALAALMSARRPHSSIYYTVGPQQIVRRGSTPPPSAGESLVRRAMEHIRTNAAKHITVESVAKTMKVSRRLLEMRFKELRGCTVNRSIISCRLEETRRMLESSSESIADICTHTGWKDEIHPKKMFKRQFGMTMREYRRKNQV